MSTVQFWRYVATVCLICILLLFAVMSGTGGPRSTPGVSRQDSPGTCRGQSELVVYLEAGCPDSNRFYSFVLKPLLQEFTPSVLKIDHIPFGNAEVFQSSKYGAAMACQHGIEECRVNTFMACARLNTEPETYQKYIMCLMANDMRISDTYLSVKSCADPLGAWDNINRCVMDRRQSGKEMTILGEKTREVHHSFIPWITLDGDGRSDVQHAKFSEESLRNLICSRLCEDSRPEVCGS